MAAVGYTVLSPDQYEPDNNHTQSDPASNFAESTQTDSAITIRVPASHRILPTLDGPEKSDGPNSHWFYSSPITVKADTVITGFSITMEDADEAVLHHVSVGILDRPSTICPAHFMFDGGAHEIYSASRHMLEPVELPAPYGIQIQQGEQLIVEFMAHPQAAPHGAHDANHVITPTLIVTLTTDTSHTTPVDFIRLRLDDSPCIAPLAHQAFTVPTSTDAAVFTKTTAGNEQSSSYQFAASSTIVLGGANFWPNKGAQDVSVLLDDQPVARFIAQPVDTPSGWNIPFSDTPIAIQPGSVIAINATYRNPFAVPILDAAGMYGFYYTTTE